MIYLLARYFKSQHNYAGIILGCVIEYTDSYNVVSTLPIELLIDDGFEGELILPQLKCEQLGLIQNPPSPTNIMTTGNGNTGYVTYSSQVKLTIIMDDLTPLSDYLHVASLPEDLEIKCDDSSNNMPPETDLDQPEPELETPNKKQKVLTKKLSPVRFDMNDGNLTPLGKHEITRCIIGFTALGRMNLKVDPRQRKLYLVLKKFRRFPF